LSGDRQTFDEPLLYLAFTKTLLAIAQRHFVIVLCTPLRPVALQSPKK
jgi:hypothetical protein